MEKCASNSVKPSENTLQHEVINTVLDNVNNAICFYHNKPSTAMKLSLEETLIDNLPFAKLVAKHSKTGAELLEKLEKLSNEVIGLFPINKIELSGQGA